jgi:hypothetical protein
MYDIIFETKNHIYNDVFNYKILNYSNNCLDLLISRIDDKKPWWLDLFVDVIIKYENQKIYSNQFHIGRSTSSYYKVSTIYLENLSVNIDFLKKENDNLITEFPIINIDKNGKIFNYNDDIEFNFKKDDIIILIPNIIFVKAHNNIISYNERFLQTIETLKSIYLYLKYDNISIILLEQSNPPIKYLKEYYNMIQEFSKYCNYIIQYKDDLQNEYYSNTQTENKSLGEMYVLNNILNRIKNIEFKSFLKIGGRYSLTQSFDISPFLDDYPTFKVIKGEGRLNIIVFSNLYSIPYKYLLFYLEHQKIWANRPECIEHILTMFVESLPEFNLIDKIHMCGKNAATNTICYI